MTKCICNEPAGHENFYPAYGRWVKAEPSSYPIRWCPVHDEAANEAAKNGIKSLIVQRNQGAK